MSAIQLSSGDLIADRRAGYARMLAQGGEFAQAAEVMEQALEQAPGWAAGWFRYAEYAEKSGDLEAAAAALSKVLAFDPADVFGAGLKRALIGAAEMPVAAPSRYVEQLFDDYADRFETSLVEKLGYDIPAKLAAGVLAHARGFARVVDLGCGTGLFGNAIRAGAEALEGFDLSTRMLGVAAKKHVYDRLAQADLSLPPERCGVFAPGLPEGRADLIAAADVLIYLGDLTSVFDIAARLAAPEGLFAFSVEDSGGEAGFILRPSLRYAHSQAFVRERCAQNGFIVLTVESTVIRMDAGEPVPGAMFVCRKTARGGA